MTHRATDTRLDSIVPCIVQAALAKSARLAGKGRHNLLVLVPQLVGVVGIGVDIVAEGGSITSCSTWETGHVEAQEEFEVCAFCGGVGVADSGRLPVVSSDIQRKTITKNE